MNRRSQPISLTKAEKHEQKLVIKSYISTHPLERRSFSWPFTIVRPAAGLAVALIMITGLASFAYAAEGSLPGEPLYSLKTHLNEPAVALLKISPEEKIDWELEIMNRRLEEARILLYQDRLNEKVESDLANALERSKVKLYNTVKRVAAVEQADTLDDLEIHLHGIARGESVIISSLGDKRVGEATSEKKYLNPIFLETTTSELPEKPAIADTNGPLDDPKQEDLDKRKNKALEQLATVEARQQTVATSSQSNDLYRKANESLEQAKLKIKKADEDMKRGLFRESEDGYRQAQIEAAEAHYILKKIPSLTNERPLKTRDKNFQRDDD